jgi:hypothetical protein
MTTVCLDMDDAVELASTLEFLVDWLDVLTGHELRWLPLANAAHPIVEVRASLARGRAHLDSAEILP